MQQRPTEPTEFAGGIFDYTVSILDDSYQITFEYETEYFFSERWLSISLYGADLTDDESDGNGSLIGYSAVDGSDKIIFATSYSVSEAEFELISNGSLAGYGISKDVLGGDDLLKLKNVYDYVYTYDGDDLIYAENVRAVWGGEGNDTIVGSTQVFYGEDGDDYIDISLGGSEYTVQPASAWGGAGNDTLIGGDYADQLVGNDGADVGYAGKGKDRLVGGAGNDTLFGEGGRDFILGQEGNDHLDGGAGRDRIDSGAGDDVVNGGGGRDRIKGGAGADELSGGFGDDFLNGGTGKDVLLGGTGKDKLIGGRHSDFLTGGTDSDRFVFSRRGGNDTITDFQSSEDELLFKNIGQNDLGDLEITQQGDDVLIDYHQGTVLLLGVTLDEVFGANILFA